MKKLIIPMCLLLLAMNSFSQEPKKLSLTKDEYLNKSSIQKKSANIFLIGGAACMVVGIVFPKGEYEGSSLFGGDYYKNDDIRGVFLFAGLTSMLVSIPFYLAASKNKRRAQKVSVGFDNQRFFYIQNRGLALKTQPALTVRIRI